MSKMGKLALLLALASMPIAHIASAKDHSEQPKETAELVRPLSRTTLVVRDIDASLHLFRNILGMATKLDLTIKGPEVNALLGTEKQTVRIVILHVEGSEIGNVGLLSYPDSRPDSKPDLKDATIEKKSPPSTSLNVGQVALVMDTHDIDAVAKKARAASYVIISDPRVIFDRPNMITQSREMIFVGPENIAINLIQQGIPKPKEVQ